MARRRMQASPATATSDAICNDAVAIGCFMDESLRRAPYTTTHVGFAFYGVSRVNRQFTGLSIRREQIGKSPSMADSQGPSIRIVTDH